MESAGLVDASPRADVPVGADGEDLPVFPDAIATRNPPFGVRDRGIDPRLLEFLRGDHHAPSRRRLRGRGARETVPIEVPRGPGDVEQRVPRALGERAMQGRAGGQPRDVRRGIARSGAP